MNKLTDKTFVVVTKDLGEFYITERQSENLKRNQSLPFNNPNRMPSVELDGVHMASSNIVGILRASDWQEISRKKNGEWKCSSGNWHNKFEKCMCGWGKTNKTDYIDKELSAEQKIRGASIKTLIKRGHRLRDVSKMSNEELAELLLK